MLREDLDRFWADWADGRLAVAVCDACGTARVYPAPVCRSCGSPEASWVETNGRGTVYSFTTVPAREPAEADTVVALVELDAGVRVVAVVDGADEGAVEIGARLAARPDGSGAGPLRFTLA